MSNYSPNVPLSARLAEKIITKERWADDEEGYLKVKYGLEIILINAMKFIAVYGVALLLGIVWQTITVHLAYLMIRRYSFGLHATKSWVCTVVSVSMFDLIPYFAKGLLLNNWIVLGVFIFVLLNVFFFAPADTESLPLIGKDNRKKLKRKAMVCTLLLTGIALLVPIAEMKVLIMLGALYQVVSINPLVYKILNRRYHNYESYE
ncbi:Accessory gene regulator protein B [Listeria grayi]|uniref:Putative AgrB-like protein n=2 Tax=Listeria grayi TaxID=1641 RepID=D7UUZ3_LISGR|nr:accessory gene regulator ArgB-like protein [Listeria grayi]EFI85069.1 accessory protein regulator protein B [Listeria grayi DSM 20601]MBC1921938.1 accessory gene regulator ArgB-like protein [Listeria grayi]STY44725.1 Accessory gene regulator protein B [Listeria grayi]VEI30322.1 Accessory gene regulator protein B [Listeria grayi]